MNKLKNGKDQIKSQLMSRNSHNIKGKDNIGP